MRERTFRLAVRVISLLIILIVLWALGILRPGRGSVVY
jgi:hypothetical protein